MRDSSTIAVFSAGKLIFRSLGLERFLERMGGKGRRVVNLEKCDSVVFEGI